MRLFANSLTNELADDPPPLWSDVAGWAGVDVMAVGFTRSTG